MGETPQLRTGAPSAAQPMDRRRRLAEAPVNAGFLVAAVALGVLATDDRAWPVSTAILLVVLFAAAVRVQIVIGFGYTTPVQLAFVPMLLLLPVGWVPLLVCGAWIAGRLPDVVRGRVHPDRLLLLPGSCWFAIGPALVLELGGAGGPSYGDWPLYLAALAAQVVFDLGFGLLSEWLARGSVDMPPLRDLLLSPGIDALLSPLGLLAALATQAAPFHYAYLLLIPPTVLLAFYARERTGRLQAAVALADAATERERLIASASHELNTPLGVMAGLHEWLGPHRDLSPERRAHAYAAMGRELHQLRLLIRQFGDFADLRTDRPLRLEIGPTSARGAADTVATALASTVRVTVEAPEGPVWVYADPARLDQMLTTLARAAMRGSEPVTIHLRPDAMSVAFEVRGGADPAAAADGLGGEGEGEGLALFVALRLAEAQDGTITAGADDAGGCVLELRLPLARLD